MRQATDKEKKKKNKRKHLSPKLNEKQKKKTIINLSLVRFPFVRCTRVHTPTHKHTNTPTHTTV